MNDHALPSYLLASALGLERQAPELADAAEIVAVVCRAIGEQSNFEF